MCRIEKVTDLVLIQKLLSIVERADRDVVSQYTAILKNVGSAVDERLHLRKFPLKIPIPLVLVEQINRLRCASK